jgi:hypothetical protein
MKGYIFTSLVAGWRGCPVTMDCAPYSAAPAPSTFKQIILISVRQFIKFTNKNRIIFYKGLNEYLCFSAWRNFIVLTFP